MNVEEKYKELLTLTKLYLFQEYGKADWKECSKESLEFYRDFAKIKPNKPVVKKEIPPPLQATTKPPKVKKAVERSRPEFQQRDSNAFSDIKKTLEKISPNVLIEEKQEKKMDSQKNKKGTSKAIFLSLKDHPEHHAFLIKVAVAIVNKGCTAEVLSVDQFNLIQNPQLVLGTELLFTKHPQIKEKFPQAKIVPLSSISHYLKDEKKKRELWKFLCEELKI